MDDKKQQQQKKHKSRHQRMTGHILWLGNSPQNRALSKNGMDQNAQQLGGKNSKIFFFSSQIIGYEIFNGKVFKKIHWFWVVSLRDQKKKQFKFFTKNNNNFLGSNCCQRSVKTTATVVAFKVSYSGIEASDISHSTKSTEAQLLYRRGF